MIELAEKTKNIFYKKYYEFHFDAKFNIYEWQGDLRIFLEEDSDFNYADHPRYNLIEWAVFYTYLNYFDFNAIYSYDIENKKQMIQAIVRIFWKTEALGNRLAHHIFRAALPKILEYKLKSFEKFGDLDFLLPFFEEEDLTQVLFNLDRLR